MVKRERKSECVLMLKRKGVGEEREEERVCANVGEEGCW